MTSNPWFGLALITVGIIGVFVFSLLKIPVGTELFGLITLGFAILQATAHVATVKEVKMLRKMTAPQTPVPPVDKEAVTQPLPLIPTEIRETLIQDPDKVLGKK